MINESLKKYIEEVIFPQYELNDMGQMKRRYHLKTLTWTSNRPFFVDVTTPA